MSASLVGSEMCIRDRRSAGSPEQEALRAARNVFETHSAPVLSGPPNAEACLLYTSDAADDM
eukprot:6791622-Alexandrium_andersonii.AAC.1